MKSKALNILVVILLACSEPHDFEIVSSAVNVIDAKISDQVGRSYINMYVNSESGRIGIQGMDVALVTDQNDVIPFAYSPNEDLYLPQDPTFAAESNVEYRMMASVQNEIIFESVAEQIESPVNFKFAIEDTTVFEPGIDGITGVEKKAKAFVARIPPTAENTYLKLDFKYSFPDMFTGDTTIRSFIDEFVLFSNVGIAQTTDSIAIPVRSKVFSGWFFTDHTILSIFCIVGTCTFDDPCCGNICCGYSETWPAVYEIVAQSMSLEAYNYWEAAEKLNNNNGLVLDTYPFPLKGNVSCSNCSGETIGLFRVVSEIRDRITIEL